MITLKDVYDGNQIVVKGRASSTLTTFTDIGGVNILLDQATLLATPSTIDISSSAATDNASGVGARTLQIVGLGENKTYQSETITLTGTTVVTSVNKWYRVFWAKVLTVGGNGTNAGDIYIVKTGTGGTYSTPGIPGTFTIASALLKILATANQGGSCFYTTPNFDGYEWVITSINLSGATYSGLIVLQIQDFANATPYTREFYVNYSAGVPIDFHTMDLRISVGKLTDVKVIVSTASASGSVVAFMTLERQALAGA